MSQHHDGDGPRAKSQEEAPSSQDPASNHRQPKPDLSHPRVALGTWALSNPLSAATALGLFLYGFLRFVYGLFYGPLGVKPEEVGLGYGQILSQSLAGIVLVFAAVFLLLFLSMLIMWASAAINLLLLNYISNRMGSDDRPNIHRDRRGWIWVRARLLVYLGMFIWLGSLSHNLASWMLLAIAFIAVAGQTAIRINPSASWVYRLDSWLRQAASWFARRMPAWGRFTAILWRRKITVMFLATFLVTTALVGVFIVKDAQTGTAKVQRGEAWRSPLFGGASLGADLVTVAWSSGMPPSGVDLGGDRCLLYLGQSNGITVLYDANAGGSIRLPSSNVIISTRIEEADCPRGR